MTITSGSSSATRERSRSKLAATVVRSSGTDPRSMAHIKGLWVTPRTPTISAMAGDGTAAAAGSTSGYHSQVAATTIAAVETTALRFPLPTPITTALSTYVHVDATAVRLLTEDGSTGFGITAGLGGFAGSAVKPYIDAELAPLAIGQDASRPEAVWHRMWSPNKPRMRGGIGVWALSAVDIACWDLVGKTAGLPVHRLLGGFRDDVPVYGSGGWHSLSDEGLIAECTDFAKQGITAYKYKIGSARDEERTALLRREMGDDFTLFADANQRFTVAEALETARMLADYGVAWIEEPVLADSSDDLAEVAAGSPIPVAAGENVYFGWGFREICDRRAAAYLQPDVGRCGGITEFAGIAHLADAYNLALSSHLWHELSISLVGASPRGFMVEYAELIPPDALTRPFEVADGRITVPDAPGHGVELTPEAMTRFAV
ncbi:MAG: mandelate racemase/muconate lactonizing enzyme family protein [Acidimicrobiia bacterium]